MNIAGRPETLVACILFCCIENVRSVSIDLNTVAKNDIKRWLKCCAYTCENIQPITSLLRYGLNSFPNQLIPNLIRIILAHSLGLWPLASTK